MRGKNDPAAFRGKQTEIDQKFIHVSNSEYSSRTGTSFDRPDLRLEGARPLEQLTTGLRLRINNTKILSTQKAKRVMGERSWLPAPGVAQQPELLATIGSIRSSMSSNTNA